MEANLTYIMVPDADICSMASNFMVHDMFKNTFYATGDYGPFIQPREPEEILLRWASVLVANALPEWLSDMKKACKTEILDDGMADYEPHRDRFAMEVLLSAALHSRRNGRSGSKAIENADSQFDDEKPYSPHGCDCGEGRSFLAFEEWDKYSKLCKGTLSKQEFLSHACSDGKGLPFNSQHKQAIWGDGQDAVCSYAIYSEKLELTREALPASIGRKTAEFGVAELEWLAIFLSVGQWCCDCCADKDPIESINSEKPSSARGNGDEQILHQKVESDGDLAVDNLARQLGFGGVSKSFSHVLSVPFLRSTLGNNLWGNRQVLEHSVHIDNWLALCTGEKTSYLQSKMPSVEETKTLTAKTTIDMDSAWEQHAHLAGQILRMQLANIEPEYLYFDTTVSFMGCSMENLRSSLALWVDNHENAAENVWQPRICFDETVLFAMSKDLEVVLSKVQSKSDFTVRYVKMRLLWELQDHLQKALPNDGVAPNQPEAIMLCILSFPGVYVDVHETARYLEVDEAVGCCFISIGGSEIQEAGFKIENFEVVFRAAYGPQEVHVITSYSRHSNESGISISVRLRCCENDADSFSWEAWRDAFGGRLEGAELWKSDHKNIALPVTRSPKKISSGVSNIDTSRARTGKRMRLWNGWLPPRPQICKFEMSSPDFITEIQDKGQITTVHVKTGQEWITPLIIPKRTFIPVAYDAASQKSLQIASVVAVEVLRRVVDNAEMPWIASEYIRTRADEILKHGDERLALSLYELAVTAMRDSVALEKAIDILLESAATQNAVTLVENFYLSCRSGDKFSLQKFQDEQWVDLIKNQFEYILSRTNYNANVTLSYAKFCLLISSFGNNHTASKESFSSLSRCLVRNAHLRDIWSKISFTDILVYSIGGGERTALARALAENSIVYADSLLEQKDRNSKAPTKKQKGQWLCCAKAVYHINGTERLVSGHPPQYVKKEEVVKKKAIAQNILASLMRREAHGMTGYLPYVVALYKRAIAEDGNVDAMNNLGYILEKGGDGVPPDPLSAKQLYTRAIGEGENFTAMCNLAFLLHNGAKDVPPDPPRAVKLYTYAIEEAGYVDAMVKLGSLLQDGGDGVPKNPRRAVELYSRAIDEGGNTIVMYNLACLLQDGTDGVPPDPHRAVELYERAIKEGDDVQAMVNLGFLMQYGREGARADPPRAVELYNRAIDEGGVVKAMYNLARLLQDGKEGVPADPLRAVLLYSRVIEEGGSVNALNNLAFLLQDGREGVPADPSRAVKLYEQAIEGCGNVIALLNLAFLLQQGRASVPADPPRAVGLYNRAIKEHGNLVAMYNLACLLQNGADGVPADPPRAVELYSRAIEEGGNVNAMTSLGLLLEGGSEEVPADPSRAVVLYERAIEEGKDVYAIYNLACMLNVGRGGVQADPPRALQLYSRAIEEGGNVNAMIAFRSRKSIGLLPPLADGYL